MPVKFRDYYETLGVPKTAGSDEIRKAFRKLARQYHPDVAKGKDKPGAEEKFKEINEAYEVLSDPEKRKKYDALGADWQHAGAGGGGFPGGGFGFPPRHGGGMEEEWEFDGSTGFSDFFERFFGGAAAGRGAGNNPFGFPGGSGTAATGPRGHDVEADLLVSLEEALHGAQRQVSLRRSDPRTGQARTETYDVKIPAGVHAGQRIRLRGRGEGGGDLYLRVRLAQHPDFRPAENGDIFHDLTLWPWQAALGTEATIPTLEGGSARLKIPAGSQPGQKFRLRGKGLPGSGGAKAARGDLYVELEVRTPKSLSSRERELWEELQSLGRGAPS
ncbi:MAG: DnaJ domain-containing protein [Verrucomicrobia bacterium]|nr:DnaJ domain-containing protein [Verrucomicrobiota bacterium]MBV9659426.1 DnaJ domain-containing protein [Verrucomicrobiota bacterium]